MRRILPIAIATTGLFLADAGRAELRNTAAGPYDVVTIERVVLNDPVQQRDVTLRVLYPVGDGPFPVVVYSTGMFCIPQMYDSVIAHWASHGYIVIQPNHVDSPNNDRPPTMDELKTVVASRLRDVSFVIDSLDAMSANIGLTEKVDSEQVAIAGHSFGAVVAMIKTGLVLKPEYRGNWGPTFDERFRVAVLMSGVGHGMREMADDAFDGLRRPIFSSGGTNDVGRVDIGDLTPKEWRMQPFLLAPPGDKYVVITAGSDHYLGGLICKPREDSVPDVAALAVVRAMTSVFLDAYLKDDADALNYLQAVDVPLETSGGAIYEQR
jgi:hypothetical protein